MILSARRRHKVIWIALALLLPVLFAVGIYYRHNEPVNENIPTVERTKPPEVK